MRKYLYILILVMGALTCANLHYLNIADSENHVLQWNRVEEMEESLNQYDILVFGDSYAAYALRNNCSFSIFNFSYPGDNYKDMFEKLKHFLGKSKPKLVYLSADDHLFKKNTNLSEKYKRLVKPYDHSNWLLNYFPLILNRKRIEYGKIISTKLFHLIQSSSNQKSIYYDENFNLRRSIQYQWSEEKNKKRALAESIETFFSKPSMLAKNLVYIDSIIATCEKSGIEVVAFRSPTTFDFANASDSLEQHLKNRIERELGSRNILCRDYQLIFREEESLFMDPVHLNDKGAEAFTQLFCSEIIE